MNSTLYLVPVLMIWVYFLVRAELADQRQRIYFLKPIATLLVIGIAFMAFLQPNHNQQYTQLVIIGLFFSLGGDLALMFPLNRKAFSIGLGLFLTAHIVYSYVFFTIGVLSNWLVIPIVLMLAVGISFYRMTSPNLGPMKGPVIAYMIIISGMVIGATSLLSSSVLSTTQAIMILSGALLFYISDIILAANRFWKPWRYNRISLVFYYGGQTLLALAAGTTL